jgi:hypothetical protein
MKNSSTFGFEKTQTFHRVSSIAKNILSHSLKSHITKKNMYSGIILNVNYKHIDKKFIANQILSKSIVDFRVSVGARGRY